MKFVNASASLRPMFFPLTRHWLLPLSLMGILLPLAGVASERTAIYLLVEDSAVIHLTDRPTGEARTVIGAVALLPRAASRANPPGVALSPLSLNAIVSQAALENGLNPNLLHAVIATESGYRGTAVSRRGAQGLMQLMPATARSLGVTDPFDSWQNITAGARHLRTLLDAFDHDTALALAAYNAGAAAVTRYGRRIPPFAETAAYVPRVLNRLASLQRASPTPHDAHTN